MDSAEMSLGCLALLRPLKLKYILDLLNRLVELRDPSRARKLCNRALFVYFYTMNQLWH